MLLAARDGAHPQYVNILNMDCGCSHIARCSACSVPALPEVYMSLFSVCVLPFCSLSLRDSCVFLEDGGREEVIILQKCTPEKHKPLKTHKLVTGTNLSLHRY